MNEMENVIKTVPFITEIPEGTIALEIKATLFVNGKMITANTVINNAAVVQNGILRGYEYDEEHAVYKLTDEYMKELDEAEK